MRKRVAAIILAAAVAGHAGPASAYVLAVNKDGPAPLGLVDIRIESATGAIEMLSVDFTSGAGAMFSSVQAAGTVKVKRAQDAANWRECRRVTSPLDIPANAFRVSLTVTSITSWENKQDPYQIYACSGDYTQ